MDRPDLEYLDTRLGLHGRVAVVLGGAGGLGRACATELGRAGMRVAIADRDGGRLDATVARLTDDGVDVLGAALDCRDLDALTTFFAAVDDRFGALHAQLNIVGGTFRQDFEQTAPKGWDALIRANYTWLLGATQLAIPRMRATGGGSIINMGSIEGSRAAPGFSVYAGLKAAVANFARSLAVELAPDRIRVNTIAPDFVPTEGLEELSGYRGDGPVEQMARRISTPMGRDGDDGDVAGCALFLASDLSRFVTGSTLHPDGGAYASAGWFNWPGHGFQNTVPAEVAQRFVDGVGGGVDPVDAG
jgi:NAD(P)-dependent dehydrogenase (short-subunit alcohol dehydrogenase family)